VDTGESFQSKIIKRAVVAMNFKRSTQLRLEQEGRFVRQNAEQQEPGKRLRQTLQVDDHVVQGRKVYVISPRLDRAPDSIPTGVPNPLQVLASPRETLTVLYLHGGAYMAGFLPMHWRFIQQLVKLTGARIIAPDYALAPQATWHEAFSLLDAVHGTMLSNLDPKSLVVMGDSAGAGLALAWCMHLRDGRTMNELEKVPRYPDFADGAVGSPQGGVAQISSCRTNDRSVGSPQGGVALHPGLLVLLSPWLDVTMTNPEIFRIEPDDPYLSVESLQYAGCQWAGTLPRHEWQVSPLHGDLSGLPPVTVFTGTADVLNPDARLFCDRMSGVGGTVDFHQYDHMMHDWMMFRMPEATRCMEELVSILQKSKREPKRKVD
jgi:acetyl esterase/lipase